MNATFVVVAVLAIVFSALAIAWSIREEKRGR